MDTNIKHAALALGVTHRVIRAWVKQGCPDPKTASIGDIVSWRIDQVAKGSFEQGQQEGGLAARALIDNDIAAMGVRDREKNEREIQSAFEKGRRQPDAYVTMESAAVITGYTPIQIRELAQGSQIEMMVADDPAQMVVHLGQVFALIAKQLVASAVSIERSFRNREMADALEKQADELCDNYQREFVRREQLARQSMTQWTGPAWLGRALRSVGMVG